MAGESKSVPATLGCPKPRGEYRGTACNATQVKGFSESGAGGARSGKDVLPRKGSREWLRLKILITKCTERLFTKFRQNDGGRLSSAVWTKCLRYLRGFYGWGGVVGVDVAQALFCECAFSFFIKKCVMFLNAHYFL